VTDDAGGAGADAEGSGTTTLATGCGADAGVASGADAGFGARRTEMIKPAARTKSPRPTSVRTIAVALLFRAPASS